MVLIIINRVSEHNSNHFVNDYFIETKGFVEKKSFSFHKISEWQSGLINKNLSKNQTKIKEVLTQNLYLSSQSFSSTPLVLVRYDKNSPALDLLAPSISY